MVAAPVAPVYFSAFTGDVPMPFVSAEHVQMALPMPTHLISTYCPYGLPVGFAPMLVGDAGGPPSSVREFFDACETGKGWAACKAYCTPDATFASQAEPLAEITTLEAYTDWMGGLATTTMPGCSYELHFAGVDEERSTSLFFATFRGTHSGPGPCDPTGKSTTSHYLYSVHTNADGKIDTMTKVWNAPWAMRQLGWAPEPAAPAPSPAVVSLGTINREAAKAFFEACETGKGWEACQQYCVDHATFSSQAEPLAEITTLSAYADWMKGLATTTMPGCSYALKFEGEDALHGTVGFFAVFKGKHTGPGPCEPTKKSTKSDYAYFIHFDGNGKIDSMIKVWNANWAMKQLGWMEGDVPKAKSDKKKDKKTKLVSKKKKGCC